LNLGNLYIISGVLQADETSLDFDVLKGTDIDFGDTVSGRQNGVFVDKRASAEVRRGEWALQLQGHLMGELAYKQEKQ